jgi:hypothetical protein
VTVTVAVGGALGVEGVLGLDGDVGAEGVLGVEGVGVAAGGVEGEVGVEGAAGVEGELGVEGVLGVVEAEALAPVPSLESPPHPASTARDPASMSGTNRQRRERRLGITDSPGECAMLGNMNVWRKVSPVTLTLL